MQITNASLSSPKQRLGTLYKTRGAWASASYKLMGRSLHSVDQCPSAWRRRGEEEDQRTSATHEALWTLLVMPEAPELTLAVRPSKITRSAMKCPSCLSVTYTQTCAKCKLDRQPVQVEVGWSKNIPECAAWEERAASLGRTLIGQPDYERVQKSAAALQEAPLMAATLSGAWRGCLATGTLDLGNGQRVGVSEPVLAVPPEGSVDDDSIYLLQAVQNASPALTDAALEWHGLATRGALALDLVNAALSGVRRRVRCLLPGAGTDAEPGFCELSAQALTTGRAAYQRAAESYLECLRTGQWPGYDHDGAGNIAWRILDLN